VKSSKLNFAGIKFVVLKKSLFANSLSIKSCLIIGMAISVCLPFALATGEEPRQQNAPREKPRGTTVFKTDAALYAFLKSKPTKKELIRRLGPASSEPQYPESLIFEVSIKGEKPTRIICFITDGRMKEWAWMGNVEKRT
jgi:hypothetical protein